MSHTGCRSSHFFFRSLHVQQPFEVLIFAAVVDDIEACPHCDLNNVGSFERYLVVCLHPSRSSEQNQSSNAFGTELPCTCKMSCRWTETRVNYLKTAYVSYSTAASGQCVGDSLLPFKQLLPTASAQRE